MADLNVFEMTNMALKNLDSDTTKKSVKESVQPKRVPKSIRENKGVNKISCKKLKLESKAFMEEAEDDDFDFTPDDEVVLVIDTEMEEVPETEEDAVAAAEKLVGGTVCKCSVCGANYVCDHTEAVEEDVDGEVEMVAEEDTCPICGEEAPQIVVGEIVADETAEVEDEVDIDVDETDDEVDVDVDVDETEFDDTDFEESCGKKSNKRPTKMRKEATRRPLRRPMSKMRAEAARRPMPKTRNEAIRRPVRRPMSKMRMESNNLRNRTLGKSTKTFNFNEGALNRLFTKFATENYENVKSVRFNNGSLVRGKLVFEGVVTTKKGTNRNIKLVSENFRPTNGTMKLRMQEVGPFTETAIKSKKTVPFVLECAVRGNSINPTQLKYCFNTRNAGLKESKTSKNVYKVYGLIK